MFVYKVEGEEFAGEEGGGVLASGDEVERVEVLVLRLSGDEEAEGAEGE